MKIGSKELIRDMNKQRILEVIIESGGISRADLAKRTGLTKATTGSIAQSFIDNGLAIETGIGDSSIGRKPTIITLKSNAGYVLCAELGEKYIETIASNLLGTPIFTQKTEYDRNNAQSITDKLKEALNAAIELIPESKYGIVNIILSIHGSIYKNSVSFAPFYKDIPKDIAEIIGKEYDIPVYLFNKANLATLGENIFSVKLKNMACMFIHPDVGLGVMINGRLCRNSNGFAGEFGHTIAESDGRQCVCGNKGCLNAYLSQDVLLDELAKLKNVEHITFEQYALAYSAKDADALEITRRFIKYMTIALNNVLNSYSLDALVLNCSFTNTFPEIFDEIKSRLNPMANIKSIRLSALDDRAVLLGAACAGIIKFLGIESFNPKLV